MLFTFSSMATTISLRKKLKESVSPPRQELDEGPARLFSSAQDSIGMDPPHFRKASSEIPSCGTCEYFSDIGFCGKYDRPMFSYELCDSFVSILGKETK